MAEENKSTTEEEIILPSEDATEEVVADDPQTVAEWKDRALRAHAEMQNMRKRLDSDVEDRTRARTEGLLSEFITIQDHLNLAMQSKPEGLEENKDASQFIEGVRAIGMAMEMMLARYGVATIKPGTNDEFNPDEHEAIRSEEREGIEKNELELVRNGYRMGRRILRPAQVCLFTPKGAPSDSEGDA